MSETPIEQAVTAVEAEAVPAADAAASALQADVTAKMDELRQSMPGLVEELVAKAHEIGGAMLSRFHEVVATVEQHLGMAQPPAPVESAPVAQTATATGDIGDGTVLAPGETGEATNTGLAVVPSPPLVEQSSEVSSPSPSPSPATETA